MNKFNATEILEELKNEQKAKKRRQYRQSRLDKHRAELIALHEEGASLSHLQLYLKKKRIKVARSTILRYLQRINEDRLQ